MLNFLTRLLVIPLAHAEDIYLPNPLGGDSSIVGLISRIFNGLVYIAAAIAPIFIIWGAFQMLTSGGQAEKFNSGKKAILYAVIGFLIVLMASGIVKIIQAALTVKG